MFQKCFSTLGCPDYTLIEVLELAQTYGVDCVEIRALENEVDLPAYFTRKGITPQRVAELCEWSGVSIAAFNSSLKISSAESDWQATLDAWAPWIVASGAPSVRIFDGAAEAGWDTWLKTAHSRSHFWRALKAARGWNFDLIVETHDTLLDSARILDFVQQTKGAFPILWDAHHTWRKGEEPWDKTWLRCQQHIRHVHTKDSIDKPSARHPFTYCDLGTGEMDPAGLSQLLIESNYKGVLSLEWERMWHPYLAPLAQALSTFIEMASPRTTETAF